MNEIPNVGGQGKTQPTGRGIPTGMAPSGLSGPGRGVGVPNMMNMMPTMGRGATPIPQQRMPMPMSGMMMPQMGGGMPGVPQIGGMVRPPMVNPMMIRPPQGGMPSNQNTQNQ